MDLGEDGGMIPPFTAFRMGHLRLVLRLYFELEGEGLLGGFGGFFFGFAFAQFLHFAHEDAAQAGGFLFFHLFGVGGLLFRADEGSVGVSVGFADDGFFRILFFGDGAVAVVEEGYLQSVDEDSCSARVDLIGG
jgi:hypothetical protein